ncbi:winged-helix DNA-binding transcription factor family protein [Euphorbia peplus]|nr:winged-helix DNA-binding transcription factor family protein [Euphorbia peplus]
MDPPFQPQLQPQTQPSFFPFPTTAISAAAVHTAAPVLTPAQISPEVAQNHVNAFPTATQTLNHPSYTDMIYAAITALKERDGSSKRAIAKYIERAFTGLPPTHSALLTHHLKRLKNSGLLVMVKKSYMMPRSELTVDNGGVITASAAPVDPYPAGDVAAVTAASSPTGPKRGRGRPPKPKPEFSQSDLVFAPQPNDVTVTAPLPPPMENSDAVMVPVGLSISTQPNIAPIFTDSGNNVPNSGADLGRRRPGRPKKFSGQSGALAVVNTSGKRRGRPPKGMMQIGVKKSPGRPRKPKSVAVNGVKKNPKRLPKSVVVPYAPAAAAAVHNSSPKPRGRPRKGAALTTAPVAVSVALALPAKRQGRPPKVAGIGQPKMRGRPVGRPKKNANMSWSQSQSQADAYGDLKRKFEIFQSRVKQAVSLLRPTLNSETAITAIAAIQDLEEIATLDLNAPLREEAPLSQLPQPQLQQPLGQGTVVQN